MLFYLALVTAAVYSSQALPRPESPQVPSRTVNPKQVFYVPERQQYNPQLQYDFPLLDPQFQVPGYNFIGDKQHFPRVQPQIVLYHGGAAPGQSFLLQPGSPPGNFLVPQPGPNVILRDGPAPARPVFVAGYPKPAHIPPIEKDAEEVPTNPSKIPPLSPKGESMPEKLETFDEDNNSKKTGTEAEVLAEADRNPFYNTRNNLRPGQSFFILNGQPLFSNFPYGNQIYPGLNFKYGQVAPSYAPQPASKNVSPFQNVLFRSGPIQDIPATQGIAQSNLQQDYPDNLVLLNHPSGFQDDAAYRNPLPINLEEAKDDNPQLREERFDDNNNFGILQLRDNFEQDDSVVIDAKEQLKDEASNPSEADAEVVSAADKPVEPTIAQAQPGAIALAGPGGVAAAAPRGTAFVGREGIAISSPQATAVAGPREEAKVEEKNKKQNKRKQ